ncbi:hypothetical protein LEMLEM_LOCUS10696, partial [Lemmus lemmus]
RAGAVALSEFIVGSQAPDRWSSSAFPPQDLYIITSSAWNVLFGLSSGCLLTGLLISAQHCCLERLLWPEGALQL